MTTEELASALARHKPTDVIVRSADGELKTIKVPGNRKKWSAVIAVVEKIAWESIELRGRTGDTLAILEEEAPANDNAGELRRDERVVDMLIRAQEKTLAMTLSYREKEAGAALTACVAVMREMVSAVSMLSKVHEMQLQAVQSTALAQMGGAGEDDPNALQSMALLKQIAPMLLSKMLAPPDVAPSSPKNGTPKNGAPP